VVAGGGDFAGRERARLDAGQVAAVIRDGARLPELAVTDAADADVGLPAHHVGDRLLDLRIVDGLAAMNAHGQVLAPRPGWAAAPRAT
jgi:hypothetical protein